MKGDILDYVPVEAWYSLFVPNHGGFEDGLMVTVPTRGGSFFTVVLREGGSEEARARWALVDQWVAAGLSWPEAVELVWFDGAALAVEEE